jgi:cytochrome o ubiquinol oxidase subunit 2
MIYTMNGMVTPLNLRADHPGTFHGLSSHYSGDGFANMHFEVTAVAPDQFNAWVEATRKAGPTLDAAAYGALAKQTLNTAPFTYRAVDTGLFREIVSQRLPPGPGPVTGRPNPSVSPTTEP